VLWEKGALLEELNRPDRFGGSRGTSVGLLQEVVVLVVGLESLQVVSLLDVLHLVINTSLGEVAALSLRGAIDHAFPIMIVVLQ
jgi:hypothetical protein